MKLPRYVVLCTLYTFCLERVRPIYWFQVIWTRDCGPRGVGIIQTDVERS